MSIVQLSFWDEDIPVQPELPQAAKWHRIILRKLNQKYFIGLIFSRFFDASGLK